MNISTIVRASRRPHRYRDRNGVLHPTIIRHPNGDSYWNLPVEGVFDYNKVEVDADMPIMTKTTTVSEISTDQYSSDGVGVYNSLNIKTTNKSVSTTTESWSKGNPKCHHRPIIADWDGFVIESRTRATPMLHALLCGGASTIVHLCSIHHKHRKQFSNLLCILDRPYFVFVGTEFKTKIIDELRKHVKMNVTANKDEHILLKQSRTMVANDLIKIISSAGVQQCWVSFFGFKCDDFDYGCELMKQCRMGDNECDIVYDLGFRIPSLIMHWAGHYSGNMNKMAKPFDDFGDLEKYVTLCCIDDFSSLHPFLGQNLKHQHMPTMMMAQLLQNGCLSPPKAGSFNIKSCPQIGRAHV